LRGRSSFRCPALLPFGELPVLPHPYCTLRASFGCIERNNLKKY
jgi:hypothetical protein